MLGHGEKGKWIWFGLRLQSWNQTNVDGKRKKANPRASLVTRTTTVPSCVIETGVLHAVSWDNERTIALTIVLLGSNIERTRGLDTRFCAWAFVSRP